MATGRLPDPNTAPVTAKGDLYTYSTVPAKLAVGSNGDTLVADSSTTTGLRWQADWNTGKNKIINGDFSIWQRGTSFTVANAFNADRYTSNYDGTGVTRVVSQQTFTPGTAPVAGYEAQYFCRIDTSVAGTGQSFSNQQNWIEDVRTLAGQTVTLSFWLKADTNRTLNSPVIVQNFGSGGSTAVNTTLTGDMSVTTSWQRFSYTFTMPSVSGKTIGSSSYIMIRLRLPANTTSVIDTWGWQLEAGSVATPFTTATGTLAGELAACQRYYQKSYLSTQTAGQASTGNTSPAYAAVTTSANSNHTTFFFNVAMRAAPTVTIYSPNSGTAARVYDGPAGVDRTAVAERQSNSQAGLYVSGTPGAVGNWLSYHYVAEIEL